MKLLVLAVYVIASLFGLYKLKIADVGFNLDFAVGFISYATAFLIWIALLKLYPLSTAFPLAAGSLIIGTQIVGALKLDEPFGPTKALAIALLLAGLATLAFIESGKTNG